MFGEMVAVCSNLPHPLVNTAMVIPFSAFVTEPGGNVFDNDERLAVPKVFASPPSLQLSRATQGTYFARYV